MRTAIFIGTEGLGTAMFKAARAAAAQASDAVAVDFVDEAQFRRDFLQALQPEQADHGYVVLAPRLSGQPLLQASLILEEKGLYQQSLIVCGVNLPMAIAALVLKDAVDSDQELAKTLEAEAKAGIKTLVS